MIMLMMMVVKHGSLVHVLNMIAILCLTLRTTVRSASALTDKCTVIYPLCENPGFFLEHVFKTHVQQAYSFWKTCWCHSRSYDETEYSVIYIIHRGYILLIYWSIHLLDYTSLYRDTLWMMGLGRGWWRMPFGAWTLYILHSLEWLAYHLINN